MGTVKTTIDRKNDLTIIVASGEITVDDIFNATRKYLMDSPTHKLLWNFMEADGSKITSGDFQKMHVKISGLSNILECRKVAVVVSRDIGFGLSRLSATYADCAGINAEHNVFRALEEALAWLEAQQEYP
jgi:hypothetical protein